jgi:tetratricopeptide (TPR) repeat protein
MVTTLFNLLAVVYAFRSLQIARTVWLNWRSLRSSPLTAAYHQLAEQAAFFLSVPLGVLLHEGAHALAIVAFNGRVVEFGYRFFWGFVRPAGTFTANQVWFIALAGTLGSLVFGAAAWLALRNHPSPVFQYFGLRTFRFQIFFSLVYYPIFTLMGFYGDWRIIYDFNLTPLASGVTAVLHAAGLALFWWADRGGFFEMAGTESAAARDKLADLERRASDRPQDIEQHLQLIDGYRQAGMTNKALQQIRTFLKRHPNSAEGHLQMAAIESHGKRQIPGRAQASAERALSLGLASPAGTAYAHQLLGQYNLDLNRLEEAIQHFSQGIGALPRAGHSGLDAHLRYLRAMAYRRRQDYYLAYEDIRTAIEQARLNGHEPTVDHYQRELETIERHAGRSFGSPPPGGPPPTGGV